MVTHCSVGGPMDSMWDPMVDEQLWPWDGTQDGRQTAQETGQEDLVFRTS